MKLPVHRHGTKGNSTHFQLDHRLWPPPAKPWVLKQVWHDLVFAHWLVSVDYLHPLIPDGLRIDTYDRQAWIGVVPFRMTGVRPRLLSAVPWLSAFPELNVRPYVVTGDKPGVWFFSLEAANPVALAIARRWYMLSYFYARMLCRNEGSGIVYSSQRIHQGAPTATFNGQYHPTSEVFRA